MRHVPLRDIDDELLGLMFRWLMRIELPAGHTSKESYERSSKWLRQLHEAFIAPLRSYLPRKGKVVLAPFAHLHLLPLGAALNPATERYAIDEYALAFAPNLAALRVALDQVSRTKAAAGRQTPERLLSVAYPGNDPKRKDYLPNVVPEARAAARHFDPWATTPLYEKAATPDAVLANARGQDVVHLGCHGLFNPVTPHRSGLMLSGGWLTVQRIINELRLDRTKLAIIAACLSGRIGLRHGEEHVGLVQAMMSARARAVVASLWQVNDAATRALFEAFYAGIKAGSSPADALANAAREVRSRPGWEHPYYWAAFQVSGLGHGANGSGLAQMPNDVVRGIEDAYRDSMERARGGSTMDPTTLVENSRALLEHIDEDLDKIRATLDPAERDRMVARLRELDEQAAGVQTADDLLKPSGAVHQFVEETPALAGFRSEEVDVEAIERSRFGWEDLDEPPEAQYVWENVTGIRNYLHVIRWNLEEQTQESNDDD
jgi:hypothetical protein